MQIDNQKIIRAWTFYDWANSVFPLVITSAIFPNFYDAVTVTKDVVTGQVISHNVMFLGVEFENQNIYSFVYAFALFIVVLTSPILSGIADYLGNKKFFLQFFCYLGAISCMGLCFFDKNYLELSFVPFILATIGYWASVLYYNSYLPQIASPENQDKVSARGFALGYFGSSILLIICLIGIIVFKYDEVTHTGFKAKNSFLLVGFWWIIFAQYTFRFLPKKSHNHQKVARKDLFYKGFKELTKVYTQIKLMPQLKRFLSSYFFYNMGVQTIMVVAVLFARNEIDWGIGEESEKIKTSSLIISILIIQFVGIAGSFIFSWLSKLIGNIKTLITTILIWIFICIYTFSLVNTPFEFYVVAFLVGLVMGGVQSLSRSTYSKYLPETDDHTSFFSFYDVLEKLGMILGTISFGLISQLTGGMRNSILSLITFFIIGLIIAIPLARNKKENSMA
ncbi:MAG: MFS transporter [Bacteroidota bacterium]|jgi:UMF1 family MFS transporter